MKYINTFEKYGDWKYEDKYWQVTLLQPYFRLSLKKIGVPDDLIEDWCLWYTNENVLVYIYKEKVKQYNSLTDDYDEYFEWILKLEPDNRDHALFMGKVKLQDFELTSDKFNL